MKNNDLVMTMAACLQCHKIWQTGSGRANKRMSQCYEEKHKMRFTTCYLPEREWDETAKFMRKRLREAFL